MLNKKNQTTERTKVTEKIIVEKSKMELENGCSSENIAGN